MTDINPFYSAKCTPEALEKMQEIREAYKVLSDLLNNFPTTTTDESGVTPPGAVIRGKRELALANTNLEQSSMWAIKSISHYNVDKTNQ